MRGRRILLLGLIALVLNSAYLLVDDAATLLYISQVLGHLVLGTLIVGLGGWIIWKESWPSRGFVAATLLLATVSGVAVIIAGNTIGNRGLLAAHIAAGAIGVLAITSSWAARREDGVTGRRLMLFVIAMGLLAATRPLWPAGEGDVIENSPLPPATMAEEAMGGAGGPFFPSSAETTDGKLIPESFFLESESCGRSGCHEDVTAQWKSSVHHLSSFNNPWYSKSIEYMQEVAGLDRPQWCAGCHDHALLFSGQMKQPVAEFTDSPAAQAGLGCMSCHAVREVKGTLGNGGLVMHRPAMHELATSDDPVLRWLHDFVLRLDPGPHRSTFLRPFHEAQPAEFCSSCHKVHLDEPVNGYRWMRGFNTYDNWQASGVSGQGARSFYEPDEPATCLTCHMKRVPSSDAASADGLIRSHDFAAANTALPTLTEDIGQLRRVSSFLQASQVRLDIFAAGDPVEPVEAAPSTEVPLAAATTFAVGQEQGLEPSRGVSALPHYPIHAPLRDGSAVLAAGRTTRLDVVVRTLGLGHFFPTGTVDAQEAWIELKAVDEQGRAILWSGAVDDEGVVDPAAHFYRSLLVDERGNAIDKRNAFAARAAVYVNLIPPGAADVARYALAVPGDAAGEIIVSARLRYRKFTAAYTHFSFRGKRDTSAAGDFAIGFDDGAFLLTGSPDDVPVVPIVTMAETTRRLRIRSADGEPAPDPSSPGDSLRWNDYGIGLLLQGHFHAAEEAFLEVTRLAPRYADGWVNLARAQILDSDLDSARESLRRALAVRPGFHKARYFRGLYFKALGDYDLALKDFDAVAKEFPRDRVVLNQIGRVLFLAGDPETAISAFERVLEIDSEDLMAHYNLMLCFRATGDLERSADHEARYLRFKADESTQELARGYRARDANANREALPIHTHGS